MLLHSLECAVGVYLEAIRLAVRRDDTCADLLYEGHFVWYCTSDRDDLPSCKSMQGRRSLYTCVGGVHKVPLAEFAFE